jgi:uncharacterized protein (DUF2164 family)
MSALVTRTESIMTIKLSDDTRAKALKSIRRYFAEQLDLDLGDLQSGLLLDFVLAEIGPSVYNAAVADAQVFLRDRITDLEGTCFEPEFNYWKPENQGRRSKA